MAFVEALDGVLLAYDDTGPRASSGDGAGADGALLCLAGLTRNREDFDPVLAHFGDQVRIIRMDYRGRGASDWADPATYQIPQEAQDALVLLDHLGLERVTVLGTSRGGLIAMVLAASARARLSGVILNDIGPELAPEGLAQIMTYIGKPPPFADLAAAAAALPAIYAETFQDVTPEAWADMAARLYESTPEGLRLRYDPRLREAVAPAFAPDAPTSDLWPLFDALAGVPLGVIRGANSDLLSSQTLAKMHARRPDMITGEVPARGHVPFLDEPQAVAVIAAILSKVKEGA